MSRCAWGPLVFWLLTMLFTGATFCACSVCAQDHGKNGVGLGGPSDWRDWLLDEDARPAYSDPLVRRITPKSVFVAPSLSGCSEGYRQDGMGRCIKPIKVDQAAQLDFILQKLNAKFAPANNKKENKDDAGPFHVNIPISLTSHPPQNVSQERLKTETQTTTVRVMVETNATEGPKEDPAMQTNEKAPSPIGDVSGRPLHSENTVKRRPGGGEPFVIVVADNDNRRPISSVFHEDGSDRVETATEINVTVHVQETSTADALPKTTVDFTNTMTVTDADWVSEEYGGAERTTTTATEPFDGDTETTSTPFPESTTQLDGLPTYSDADSEISTVYPSTLSPLEVEVFTESTFIDTRTPAATVSENVENGQGEDETREPFETDSFEGSSSNDETPNKYGMKNSNGGPPNAEPPPFPATADCENLPPSREVDILYDGIFDPNSAGRGCRPVEAATARYPVRTGPKPPIPYLIRFPTDDLGFEFRPPTIENRPLNGFIRFPERLTISTPRRPEFGSKIRGVGDATSSFSTSSFSWYSPSSSWFPLIQAQNSRGTRYGLRQNYENDDAEGAASNLFRKRFRNRRPSSSSPIAWPSHRN